jgi:hypothetical protein
VTTPQKGREDTSCIYCGSLEPPSNREHVVPVAMGVFEQNWTLDCVCDACNRFFSRELELVLARDTAEGLLRIDVGIKPAATAVPNLLNRRSKMTLNQPGPFQGTRLQLFISEDGAVVPAPVPQVGFKRPGQEWCYLVEREITHERLREVAFVPGIEVRLMGKPDEIKRLRERLNLLQFFFSEADYQQNVQVVSDGACSVQHDFTVDNLVRRAAAKIMFNYAAKVLGCSAVRHSDFHAIRNFVRYGEEQEPLVCVSRVSILAGAEAATSRTHALGMQWSSEKKELLGLLSFFNEITYGVRICRSSGKDWTTVDVRHFFDPVKRSIAEAPIL